MFARNTGQLTEMFLIIATENCALLQSNYTFVHVSLKKRCASSNFPKIALLENIAANQEMMYLMFIVPRHH